jgi:hypothetical protein
MSGKRSGMISRPSEFLSQLAVAEKRANIAITRARLANSLSWRTRTKSREMRSGTWL